MYKTILNGGKYSLLVESKNENVTHWVDAIVLENKTKKYYEAVSICNPIEIRKQGILKTQNYENLTVDECLLNQVRCWNYLPFDKQID